MVRTASGECGVRAPGMVGSGGADGPRYARLAALVEEAADYLGRPRLAVMPPVDGAWAAFQDLVGRGSLAAQRLRYAIAEELYRLNDGDDLYEVPED